MNPLIVRIIGVVSGVIAIALGENVASRFYKLPSSIDPKDTVALTNYINGQMPMEAFWSIIASYAFGSFVAGSVVTFVDDKSSFGNAIFVGAILAGFGIINYVMIPHPIWFSITSTLIYIPFSLLGHYVSKLFVKAS